jgi:hypothetical protein
VPRGGGDAPIYQPFVKIWLGVSDSVAQTGGFIEASPRFAAAACCSISARVTEAIGVPLRCVNVAPSVEVVATTRFCAETTIQTALASCSFHAVTAELGASAA